MEWGNPQYFWLLLLLIPAILFSTFIEVRNIKKRQQLIGNQIIINRHRIFSLRLFCRTAIFVLLAAALCRPKWGIQIELHESNNIDILIAMDTSRSMLADDLEPTRLEAAKKAVAAFVEHLHGERVGIIAFAGSSFLICPLTTDYSAFNQMLDEINSSTIPRGGSDIGTILREVQSGFTGNPASSLLIVISDGEDHIGHTAETARKLRASGITICSVVAGSDKGAIIPLKGGDFLKNNAGNIVRSQANRQTMELLSSRYVYLDASGKTLIKLYEQIKSSMQKQSIKNSREQKIEWFQLPLVVALLLCLADFFIISRRRI